MLGLTFYYPPSQVCRVYRSPTRRRVRPTNSFAKRLHSFLEDHVTLLKLADVFLRNSKKIVVELDLGYVFFVERMKSILEFVYYR